MKSRKHFRHTSKRLNGLLNACAKLDGIVMIVWGPILTHASHRCQARLNTYQEKNYQNLLTIITLHAIHAISVGDVALIQVNIQHLFLESQIIPTAVGRYILKLVTEVVLRKTTPEEITVETISVSCFNGGTGISSDALACYDDQFGNFIEFKFETECISKFCYRLLDSRDLSKQESIANLHAASIEDLKRVILTEHLLSKELRFNFGKILELLSKNCKE